MKLRSILSSVQSFFGVGARPQNCSVSRTIELGKETPLQEAASTGNVQNVLALPESGADVTVKNKVGKTPLHLAASRSPLENVTALLNAGADVNARSDDGWKDVPVIRLSHLDEA
jgi:ankyrin repeat protein